MFLLQRLKIMEPSDICQIRNWNCRICEVFEIIHFAAPIWAEEIFSCVQFNIIHSVKTSPNTVQHFKIWRKLKTFFCVVAFSENWRKNALPEYICFPIEKCAYDINLAEISARDNLSRHSFTPYSVHFNISALINKYSK